MAKKPADTDREPASARIPVKLGDVVIYESDQGPVPAFVVALGERLFLEVHGIQVLMDRKTPSGQVIPGAHPVPDIYLVEGDLEGSTEHGTWHQK